MAADLTREREHAQLIERLERALRDSDRRFDTIVGALSDAVTIRDREHRFVYANSAAVAHLGFESWEELRDTPPASIMDDYLVWNEDGRELAMDDIPSVRILRGEEAEPLLIRTVNRASGAQRWNLLKAAPLLDEGGRIEATITIIEEVTEQKRSELGSVFLAEASAELARTLDYEQTLRNVARLTVPEIADWCAVDLLDGERDRRTVAVAHVDPQRISLAEEMRDYLPERLDPEQGLGRVLSTGEVLLIPEISEEMLRASAVDDHHLELLRAVGLRSALIVPMRIGDRTLGALTLVSAESIRVFDSTDVAFAEQLAARAAVAIENARLYSERSLIARTLQQSLLPQKLPEIPGYELASIYMPAVDGSLVGGDFYDVWAVEGGWMVLIGDVTGKGVEAAALTALVRHTVRAASEFLSSPAALLDLVDRTLKTHGNLSLCTAMCMRLDGDRVTLAAGGHPMPLYLAREDCRAPGGHGPLLGAFPYGAWGDASLRLEPESTLLAYTDGLTDARDESGERFGLERLRDTLSALRGSPVAEIADALTRTVEEFQPGAHTDDTAAIVLRRRPVSEDNAVQLQTGEQQQPAAITTST
jgi:PAS domain S-box-containing protein